jgi:hypothetical protein
VNGKSYAWVLDSSIVVLPTDYGKSIFDSVCDSWKTAGTVADLVRYGERRIRHRPESAGEVTVAMAPIKIVDDSGLLIVKEDTPTEPIYIPRHAKRTPWYLRWLPRQRKSSAATHNESANTW